MGKEVKRVPLDFDWPLGVEWKGYVNPYFSQHCKSCDGTGYNPETKQISDDWYDFENSGRMWCYNITQDEVDALIEKGRLRDFTDTWSQERGWHPIDPLPVVTPEMVNKWAQRGLGHDAINRWICVETRARRLGVYGECQTCSGKGVIWFSDEVKEKSERWYNDERYDPPIGDGWQLWETVSDGSPISPVYATPDGLVDYLVRDGYSVDAAIKFVIDDQWCASMVIVDGKIYSDIESVIVTKVNNE